MATKAGGSIQLNRAAIFTETVNIQVELLTFETFSFLIPKRFLMLTAFIGEFIGTMLLLILGNGVVANVLLTKTKGNNGGLISIAFGWAIAVFVGVFCAAGLSKAHLNPAVTIAFAAVGELDWSIVPVYLAAQFAGAMVGTGLVWVAYHQHFLQTEDADLKMAVFCTAPAIRSPFYNLVTEAIGTFVLVFAVFRLAAPTSSLGALDALPVGLLVLGIGLSLGGPTGYAINPARDLGPRIMHFILPIPNKRNSDWSYSWIPVAGPIIGGLLAAFLYKLI
jgi:glycerol uptake facilitator protein